MFWIFRFKPADFSHEKPEVKKNLLYNQDQSDDKQIPADAPDDELNKVQVKFRSNPKPTDCLWSNIETRIEEETKENKKSCKSKISDGGMDGEYFVNLDSINGEPTHLEITNSLGTSTYEFNIGTKSDNNEIVVDTKDNEKVLIETTTIPSTNSSTVIKETKTNLSRVSQVQEKPETKAAKFPPAILWFLISVLVVFFVAIIFLYFKKNKKNYHCLSANGVKDSKDSIESQIVSKKISTASNQTNDSGIGNGDTSVEFAMNSNRIENEYVVVWVQNS